MHLTNLAKKPELIELVLDDKLTVKEYGEPISFYTWDRIPLDIFTKLATADQSNIAEMVATVRELILDEKGNQVLSQDRMLPQGVLITAIGKIVERLGN